MIDWMFSEVQSTVALTLDCWKTNQNVNIIKDRIAEYKLLIRLSESNVLCFTTQQKHRRMLLGAPNECLTINEEYVATNGFPIRNITSPVSIRATKKGKF